MSERVEEVSFKRMLVFAILMESGEGVLDKSPKYVEEKFFAAMEVPYPENLLDSPNTRKLREYEKRWIR